SGVAGARGGYGATYGDVRAVQRSIWDQRLKKGVNEGNFPPPTESLEGERNGRVPTTGGITTWSGTERRRTPRSPAILTRPVGRGPAGSLTAEAAGNPVTAYVSL